MKVNSIVSYNQNSKKLSNNIQTKDSKTSNLQVSLDKLTLMNIPPLALQNNVSISFGAKLPYGNLYNVICAYCNRVMINAKTFKAIKWPKEFIDISPKLIITNLKRNQQKLTLAQKRLLGEIETLHKHECKLPFRKLIKKTNNPNNHFSDIKDFYQVAPEIYNKQLIETLKPFKFYMHSVESSVFELIKKLHSQFPQRTFQQLLGMLRKINLKTLEHEQLEILDRIEQILRPLSNSSRITPTPHSDISDKAIALQIKKLITDTKNIMKNSSSDEGFRRKVFITKLNNLTKQGHNKALFGDIRKLAEKLPTCRTSKSAFIVKYSGKVSAPGGTFQYKSSQGIAHNLICSAFESLDHIEASHNGGKNGLHNAIGACTHCNNELKGHMSFRKFIKRPNVIKNIKLHMQYLIENVDKIQDGENYIRNLAKTLEELSERKIKIDLSALDSQTSLRDVI